MLRVEMIALLLAVTCAGCGPQPHPGPAVAPSREASVTIKLTNLTYSADKVHIDGEQLWKIEDFSASIREGKLTVNGADYGPVENGDKILIEPNAVKLNGQERKPK